MAQNGGGSRLLWGWDDAARYMAKSQNPPDEGLSLWCRGQIRLRLRLDRSARAAMAGPKERQAEVYSLHLMRAGEEEQEVLRYYPNGELGVVVPDPYRLPAEWWLIVNDYSPLLVYRDLHCHWVAIGDAGGVPLLERGEYVYRDSMVRLPSGVWIHETLRLRPGGLYRDEAGTIWVLGRGKSTRVLWLYEYLGEFAEEGAEESRVAVGKRRMEWSTMAELLLECGEDGRRALWGRAA